MPPRPDKPSKELKRLDKSAKHVQVGGSAKHEAPAPPPETDGD